MIRVLIAEDNSTARHLLLETLESDPELRVVGEARNGLEAIELTERLDPDLLIMDVFMPELDGLEATKQIMIRSPRPIVIVSSAGSSEEVGLSLSATRAGALIALPKPGAPLSPESERQRREFVSLAKAMAGLRVVRRWSPRGGSWKPPARRWLTQRARPQVVTIAASTGGPAALHRVLLSLPVDFPAPILVVQHIATGFVDGFAEWLDEACALRVKKAEHDEPIRSHTVYTAPDGRHLGATPGGRILLSDDPPINGFCPSATFLFRSVSRAYRGALAAVVLTGMGRDGLQGLEQVRRDSGCIIAQDESSSIVFGMAAEAVRANLVDEVLPLDEIASKLDDLVVGRREDE